MHNPLISRLNTRHGLKGHVSGLAPASQDAVWVFYTSGTRWVAQFPIGIVGSARNRAWWTDRDWRLAAATLADPLIIGLTAGASAGTSLRAPSGCKPIDAQYHFTQL
jgi:hypothetical protein